MASAALLERLSEAKDPKAALIKEIGKLDGIQIMGPKLLVGIYIAPAKMASGLYRATQSIKEDVWQGTVGVVLKKGAQAFKDDQNNKFNGQDIPLHSWVVFRPGDARRVQINGVDCRFIEDTLIDLVIDDPELITHK